MVHGVNLTDTLKSYGLTEPAGVICSYDISVSDGGSIKRDRVWFLANVRNYSTLALISGTVPQPQRRRRDKMDLRTDTSRSVWSADSRAIYLIPLTGQVTPLNRVSFSCTLTRSQC